MNRTSQQQNDPQPPPEIKPENVRKCLKNANSPDQAIQNEIRGYLESCEKNPNFSFVLLDILNNDNEVTTTLKLFGN